MDRLYRAVDITKAKVYMPNHSVGPDLDIVLTFKEIDEIKTINCRIRSYGLRS